MIILCELRGFATNVLGKEIRCSNSLHSHHILNKAKYSGKSKHAKAVQKYVKEHPEVYIAQVCSTHNVDRWADTPAARRILLRNKNKLLGSDYVKSVWDEAPFKVFPPELRWEAVMAAPLPK